LKLKTYKAMGSEEFVLQPYLRVKIRDIRKRRARFRTGSHWLEIQQGRFIGSNRQDRTCKTCSMGATEDENTWYLSAHCTHL